MTVYAVMPVFNRLEMTRRMVDNLRTQRDADLRIVVVDDGSTDGTGQWLASQADVCTISGDGDLWWAGAVNAALRHILRSAAQRDHVLLLNNDTTIERDFVTTLVRISREHEGAAVGAAIRNETPPHELLSIGPRIDIARMHVWDLIDELSPEERQLPKRAYEVDALSGRGALYPVTVLRATGYLHSRLLPHYHADYEFAARARRKGFKTVVSTEAVVYSQPSFGVHERAASNWKLRFHKGSPQNPMHRMAFRLLVGTPHQRVMSLPRMLMDELLAPIVNRAPPPVRRFMRACWIAGRAPWSREARSRISTWLRRVLRARPDR
jgi:GT2 family glycosyltransferase